MFTLKYDGQTLSEIFPAGCIEPARPIRAAYFAALRILLRMNEPEVCVSTTNRNFPGRSVINSADLSSFTHMQLRR